MMTEDGEVERGLADHIDLLFLPDRPDIEPLNPERRDMAVRLITYALAR